ncbi:alkaline phosphatase PafA [Pedobacter flavus]|uniref:Alkaline phosphatase PafA n=1 Tax=Pedobacter flavus TaxID=3113906 RepID=A0ABU7H4S8_9SPHI|nr:alkaline phosphatase PafA [Pedobacter sp. VNH31]MEE1885998.1 alkaline phosphatase PafA [Pedobacter sp. VNH31]
MFKKNFLTVLLIVLLANQAFSQAKTQKTSTSPATKYPAKIDRPKLVVGLVVDQMRWDYLYKYYKRYGDGGFKRIINEGFSAENTYIPYTPTYTACGHASIYTGSVPSINGIIGNNWYDTELGKNMYCTEDSSVKTVGSTSKAGEMSPKNLLTSTITDELRIATNYRGKTIALSMKDRGSILPGGHTANGSYWYDGETGNFITSTFYMEKLPNWVEDYNRIKLANKFYEKNWTPLYALSTYVESTSDNKAYEGKFKGNDKTTFPYTLSSFIDKDFDIIRTTPHGNTFTLDFAKTAIVAENLGKDDDTDFLAVSLSSTDYIGHQFGPNSVEVEDTYLRLDKDLEEFFNYLDKQVGKGNYLFFISADHGAAYVPGYMKENKLPAGTISNRTLKNGLNELIERKFKVQNAVTTVINNQVIYDQKVLENVDFKAVKAASTAWLKLQEGINDAVDLSAVASYPMPELIKNRIQNGYNARRSGDVYFILKPNWFDGGLTGTTHGAWNPYDSHIPLVFMGWNVKPGKTNKVYHMTDIAPTIAAMLRIPLPNGNIGVPITEITNQK